MSSVFGGICGVIATFLSLIAVGGCGLTAYSWYMMSADKGPDRNWNCGVLIYGVEFVVCSVLAIGFGTLGKWLQDPSTRANRVCFGLGIGFVALMLVPFTTNPYRPVGSLCAVIASGLVTWFCFSWIPWVVLAVSLLWWLVVPPELKAKSLTFICIAKLWHR